MELQKKREKILDDYSHTSQKIFDSKKMSRNDKLHKLSKASTRKRHQIANIDYKFSQLMCSDPHISESDFFERYSCYDDGFQMIKCLDSKPSIAPPASAALSSVKPQTARLPKHILGTRRRVTARATAAKTTAAKTTARIPRTKKPIRTARLPKTKQGTRRRVTARATAAKTAAAKTTTANKKPIRTARLPKTKQGTRVR